MTLAPIIKDMKILIKQLDTLYEYLRLERRLIFLKYSEHLRKEELISEAPAWPAAIDYIRDFEENLREIKTNLSVAKILLSKH